MPKPYRRRKGKNGPYVGNYRATIDGRDLNLHTKDANEAQARARLAKKGKWPPIPAAVDAALDALDPGRDKTPSPPEPAEDPEGAGGGGPHADTPTPATHPPPPRETPSHEEPEDLNEAARAAAAESSGRATFSEETKAAQENGVNTELAAVMAELGGGGASGADLLDGVCDGAAAFLLWAEGKALELGVNWALIRRKSDQRLKTKPLEQSALMRKALRVGLKGAAVIHFPDFATRLTPGWAIAIGLVGGAGQTLMLGELVNKNTGQAVTVAEAVSQAQEAAQQQPPPPPAPPAS